jgi:predicted ribosome quality control (RQC) complex YloA/Tae2 family protein
MKSKNIYIQGLNKEVTFWIGTSKKDNDEMIDQASENDIWFHANNISSCHVICRLPYDIEVNSKETKYIIKMGALLCKTNTNKLKSVSKIEFVYCPVKNITKTDIVGCVSVSNGKYIII